MSANLFYCPDISGDRATLSGDQLRHATRVLRLRLDDEILLTDGRGTFYYGVIDELSKQECAIRVVSSEQEQSADYQVDIAIGFTKNLNRMEWCLEKLTELGVRRVYPLLSRYSERAKIREERLNKLMVAAMKQSRRATLPQLMQPVSFEKAISDVSIQGARLIATLTGQSAPIAHNYNRGDNVIILVGPEGGFSPDEVAAAESHGFKPVVLSTNRLRTETAAVTSVAAIHQLNLQRKE